MPTSSQPTSLRSRRDMVRGAYVGRPVHSGELEKLRDSTWPRIAKEYDITFKPRLGTFGFKYISEIIMFPLLNLTNTVADLNARGRRLHLQTPEDIVAKAKEDRDEFDGRRANQALHLQGRGLHTKRTAMKRLGPIEILGISFAGAPGHRDDHEIIQAEGVHLHHTFSPSHEVSFVKSEYPFLFLGQISLGQTLKPTYELFLSKLAETANLRILTGKFGAYYPQS